jgi:REP element-mobilizing transposase RayT
MLALDDVTSRGSKRLRCGRFSEKNRIYLVTSVTHFRERAFLNLYSGRILVTALRAEQDAGHAQTLAFVVMPDHFHWLLSLAGNQDLSTIVGRVKSRTARLVNRARRRDGRMWQDGFHDHAIRAEEDLADVARYIVANPIRAGLAKKLGDYPHWDAVWL